LFFSFSLLRTHARARTHTATGVFCWQWIYRLWPAGLFASKTPTKKSYTGILELALNLAPT